MKFLLVVVLITILTNSKVLAKQLECYECTGDECNDEATIRVVNCNDDSITTTSATTQTSRSTTTTTQSTWTIPTSSGTTETTTTPNSPEPTSSETTPLTTDKLPQSEETTDGSPESNALKNGEYSSAKLRTITRRRRDADDGFVCYTMKYKDGEATKIQKGCTKKSESGNACADVSLPANTTPLNCDICPEPKCNSSPAIAFSILLTPVVVFISFILNY
ncbi:ataxin-2 homolog [Stomoxys calcitrans]|uniref:ataxin-2 homolog n=1 Tax=Stomoxys calcitrans TaxID=35570 RepID=UPI0027E336AE|nr:ataxin-2 homolog [Stomoxys calcitrans]